MQVDLCNGHKNGGWLVSGFFEFTMFDFGKLQKCAVCEFCYLQ